jgi:hypothetical protein
MHGRGVRGEGGHLSRVKRRSEVLWAPQTLEESACKKKQRDKFSAKRQSFEGVSNAHKSHGWGGSVGGDRGKRHVQLGVGWLSVSCERRRTVKRAKTRKWMVRRRGKKNDKSGRKEGLEKNQKIWSRWCSGGSTPDPDQEGSESRPLDHRYLRKAPT